MTLDIDDTCDALHGHQQLSLFHAHYHVESGKLVAVLLRPTFLTFSSSIASAWGNSSTDGMQPCGLTHGTR